MRRSSLGLAAAVAVLATLVVPPAVDAAVDTASTAKAPSMAPSTSPVPYVGIPNVVVDLPDGDRLALGSPNLKRVMLQRYDGATGAWSAPELLFRKRGLVCGDLDARASAGAVAVILECERGRYYYDDQAPTDSVALYSPDTLTWHRQKLTGEAYEEPGIAPGGGAAVWPIGQGRYVTWTAAGGFTERRLRARGEEYTLTAVISDTAAVSYAYGAPLRSAHGCGLVVLTRTGDGPVARQEVPVDELGCADTGLANVDADTLLAGDLDSAAYRTTISRPEPTAPFAVTAIAPSAAPGLVDYDEDDQRGNVFLTAPGLPLLSLGSPDRRHFLVQTYDPVAQRWGLSREVYVSPRTCIWGDTDLAESLDVIVADLDCGAHRALATTDGVTWQSFRLGRLPLGISTDRVFVAVPGRTSTTILSRARGAVRLPLPVTGRCSLVVPNGPDSAALLAERGQHRGWPSAFFVSGPSGWVRDRAVDVPRPADGACRRIQTNSYDEPVDYYVGGRRGGYDASITFVAGRWRVDTTAYWAY